MFLFPQAEGSKERGPSQPFQPDAWLPLGPLTLLLGRWALANFPGGIAFAPCRSDPGIWHDPVLRWIECHSRPLRNRPGQDQGDPSLGQPPPCHSLREPREVPAQALPATPAPIGFVHDPFSSLLCPPPQPVCRHCTPALGAMSWVFTGRPSKKPHFWFIVCTGSTCARLGRRGPLLDVLSLAYSLSQIPLSSPCLLQPVGGGERGEDLNFSCF